MPALQDKDVLTSFWFWILLHTCCF